jgi:hypothetical protein
VCCGGLCSKFYRDFILNTSQPSMYTILIPCLLAIVIAKGGGGGGGGRGGSSGGSSGSFGGSGSSSGTSGTSGSSGSVFGGSSGSRVTNRQGTPVTSPARGYSQGKFLIVMLCCIDF